MPILYNLHTQTGRVGIGSEVPPMRREGFTGQTPRREYEAKCLPHCAEKANLILCTPSPVTNPGTEPEFINFATLPL